MYVLTLYQEAEIRKFAVEKELATTEKIATMTDREVQEKVFEFYFPVIAELPQSTDYRTKKDIYLVHKDDFDSCATLFVALPERR